MKRFLSIFLSLSMLFGATMPVWANDQDAVASEEDTFEVIASEEEVFEDKEVLSETPTPEVMEHRIFIDGKEFPCEPGYQYDAYNVYYRYTSVAEALGFSVRYDAETGMVHTEKNDTSCTFDTVATCGTVTQNGVTYDLDSYYLYHLTNIEDKMYIEPFVLEYRLPEYIDVDIRIDDETHDLFIYTPEGKRAMAEELNKKLAVWNEMQSEIRAKDYLAEGVTDLTLNIKSDFFDIEGNGNSRIQVTSAKLGDQLYAKIHTEGSGLMNLITLLSLTGTLDETPAQFLSSSDMELYFDGTLLYVKGEQQARQLIQSEDYSLLYTYPEEMKAITKQWVCTENISEGYMALLRDGDFGTYLVDSAFETSNDASPEEMIVLFEAIFGDHNFTVTENAGGKSYTYTLNKDVVLAALESQIVKMDEEERVAFDKQTALSDLNITVTQTINQDGGSNLTKGEISISNIENPWNEQMLSLHISLEASNTFTFNGADSFAFPDVSQAVNLTAYVEKLYNDTEFEDE